MPDELPLVPRRNPEQVDVGRIHPDRAGRAVPQGASPTAALRDGRECRGWSLPESSFSGGIVSETGATPIETAQSGSTPSQTYDTATRVPVAYIMIL